MWDQSSSSQFGQIIQSLMQQNPQVYQRLMQLMSQQRTAGIGSLQPRQGGGPMPMPMGRPDMAHHLNNPNLAGNARDAIMGRPANLAYQVGAFYPPELGRFPMPSGTNGPSPYGGQPPYGGSTLDSYPRMGGGSGPSSSPPVDTAAAWRQASNWMQPATPMPALATGYGGNQGTGPTLPYAQRFNTNPGPSYPAIPMPTVTGGRSQTPYTPPPFVSPMPEWQTPQRPAPFSAPASQPKTYGASQPAGPSLAQNGTSGLDWYAMQAGN